MVGKDKTIFEVPYDQMVWFQPLRRSEEVRARKAWSNSRYSKLQRWFRTTGELCISSHRRVGEGVGASIGGWVLANMRAFALTCISAYAYTPRYVYTDARIRVYTYPPTRG